MKTAGFGSISSGTMRPEDLIPEFAYTLRELRGALPRDLYNDIRKCEAAWARGETYEFEDDMMETLFDALGEYAPPYAYFGTNPGDGADYGFWLSESMEQDFDGLKVSDTSEVPKHYTGEVLHVNDHGNITLYTCRKGKLREVWALV